MKKKYSKISPKKPLKRSFQRPLIFILVLIALFLAVFAVNKLFFEKTAEVADQGAAYVIDGVRSGQQKIEISIVKPEN